MAITAAIPHAAAAALTTAAAAAATTAAAALAAAAVPFSRTSSPLTVLSIANVLSVAPGALAASALAPYVKRHAAKPP